MSHFSVFVFGEDVVRQLAPFHEFECTGSNDEYVQNVDVLQKARDEYAIDRKHMEISGQSNPSFPEYIEDNYDLPLLETGKNPDLEGNHKWGWVRFNEDGDVAELIRRTNPNAKWDYWKVGGRWNGFLKLKGGENMLSNQVKKEQIDFDGMYAAAAEKAEQSWKNATDVLNGQTWESWKNMSKRLGMEEAKSQYHKQPAVVALRTVFTHPFFNIDRFLIAHDEFIAHSAIMDAFPFAAVHEQKWHQRGEMGWFGCISDERNPSEWAKEVRALIDSVPNDTLISVVDCHI